MGQNVHWILEVGIKDGQLENFKTLMGEMVAATSADEPGTTHYEWFLSADETSCHIYERYADSAAVMVHLGNFGSKFAGRFMGCVQPTGLTVYGDADAEARKALGGLGAVHFEQIGGFAR